MVHQPNKQLVMHQTAIWVSEETTQKHVVVQRNVGSITAVRSTAQGKVFVLTLDGKIFQLVQR